MYERIFKKYVYSGIENANTRLMLVKTTVKILSLLTYKVC